MISLLLCMVVAVESKPAGLKTSYVHKLRAEIALADRVEIAASRDDGGARRVLEDPDELKKLAQQIPRDTAVQTAEGTVSSASYVTIAVYPKEMDKRPSLRVTILPGHGFLKIDDRLCEFKTKDDSLYRYLLKSLTKKPSK